MKTIGNPCHWLPAVAPIARGALAQTAPGDEA